MSLAGLVEDPKTTPLPWEFSFAITLSIIKSKTKQEGGVLRQRNNNRRLSNKTYALSAQPKGDETRRGSRMADAKLSRPAKTKITKTLWLAGTSDTTIWVDFELLVYSGPDAWSVLTGSQSCKFLVFVFALPPTRRSAILFFFFFF